MVSVIIPVYNVEKYIERCLDSIINQTYRNLEIIVVNDATPDNSMYIVERFASRDKRIRIINNPRNMGLMMTRKSGYSVATGDYFMFVDSDDYLPLNSVEVLCKKIVEDKCDIVIGNYLYEKGPIILKRDNTLSYGYTKEDVYKSLLEGELTHSLWARIYDRHLFEHEYKQFEKMTNSEDKCLFYQVVKNVNKVSVINEIVYYYVDNILSSSRNIIPLNQIENMIVADSICYDLCVNEAKLKELADSAITKDLIYFYRFGYSHNQIEEVVKKHNMEKLFSIKHAFCVLSHKEILCFLIHKTLFHLGVKRYRHGF